MNRRILVRISASGEILVEAEGFQGKGCEAATSRNLATGSSTLSVAI